MTSTEHANPYQDSLHLQTMPSDELAIDAKHCACESKSSVVPANQCQDSLRLQTMTSVELANKAKRNVKTPCACKHCQVLNLQSKLSIVQATPKVLRLVALAQCNGGERDEDERKT